MKDLFGGSDDDGEDDEPEPEKAVEGTAGAVEEVHFTSSSARSQRFLFA